MIPFNLKEGLMHSIEMRVGQNDLADNLGTAKVQVLSTSALIQFMERAVFALIKDYIPDGYATVSAEINIKHLKPATIGTLIRCIVHLKFVDDCKLFFDVAVLDELHDTVALGAHERRIVNIDTWL